MEKLSTTTRYASDINGFHIEADVTKNEKDNQFVGISNGSIRNDDGAQSWFIVSSDKMLNIGGVESTDKKKALAIQESVLKFTEEVISLTEE